MEQKNEIIIEIADEFSKLCPNYRCIAIACGVTNTLHDDKLWREIEDVSARLRSTLALEAIQTNNPTYTPLVWFTRLWAKIPTDIDLQPKL